MNGLMVGLPPPAVRRLKVCIASRLKVCIASRLGKDASYDPPLGGARAGHPRVREYPLGSGSIP